MLLIEKLEQVLDGILDCRDVSLQMYLQNVSTSAATTLHYPLSFIFIGRVSTSHIPSYFGIRY